MMRLELERIYRPNTMLPYWVHEWDKGWTAGIIVSSANPSRQLDAQERFAHSILLTKAFIYLG